MIRKLWNEFGIEKCKLGFTMPGPFYYANGICLIKGFDKYESLYEGDVRDALAEKLNIAGNDIAFRNDAEAFLEGEIFCGAGSLLICINRTSGGYTLMEMGISAQTNGYGYIQATKLSGSTWGDLVINQSGGTVGIGTSQMYLDTKLTVSQNSVTGGSYWHRCYSK